MEWETLFLEVHYYVLNRYTMYLLWLSQQDAKQWELLFNYKKWLIT